MFIDLIYRPIPATSSTNRLFFFQTVWHAHTCIISSSQISEYDRLILLYTLAKFGVVITKCTIALLCCPTITAIFKAVKYMSINFH